MWRDEVQKNSLFKFSCVKVEIIYKRNSLTVDSRYSIWIYENSSQFSSKSLSQINWMMNWQQHELDDELTARNSSLRNHDEWIQIKKYDDKTSISSLLFFDLTLFLFFCFVKSRLSEMSFCHNHTMSAEHTDD